MPYDDPDVDDPQMLVGVELPADPESRLEMAYTFAEEFARLGHDGPAILRLFQSPFYAGANAVWRALGHEAVVAIVDDCLRVWGRGRPAH